MIIHGFIQRKNKQTKIIKFSFSVRRGFVSQRVWHSSQRCWYRPKKKQNKRLCFRILFVSPFHCVKPRAIISFGKLLLQQFFLASFNFQVFFYNPQHTHTHTHTKKNKTKTVYPQNYTETNELHSNRILLLGFPEFKNGLKADLEVSLMLRTLKNSLFKCLQS